MRDNCMQCISKQKHATTPIWKRVHVTCAEKEQRGDEKYDIKYFEIIQKRVGYDAHRKHFVRSTCLANMQP